jgi:large subunit ribosomal protein L18
MGKAEQRISERKNRAARVRKKISGTAERPRLCVRRSLNHIYAQIIDDVNGISLAQTSSSTKDFMEKHMGDAQKTKSAISELVGEIIAQKAKAIGIEQVVFDRKGYAFQGRVKSLADAARKAGLVF